MSDIIDVPIGSGQHEIQVTMLAAADELERLRARLAEVNAELDRLYRLRDSQADRLEAKDREIATLTYERDGWKREDEAECKDNAAQLMVWFFWAVALAVVYIVLTEGEP